MSIIADYVKQNPIKSISAVLVFCGSVITAVWAIEDRYVLKKELTTTKAALAQERQAGYDHLKDLILMQYEDQIQELTFKKNDTGLTAYEKTRLSGLQQRVQLLSTQQ